MKMVIDTRAILWAVSEPAKLSADACSVLEHASTEALVSPISCAEIACAIRRHRLVLDRHWRVWFRHFVELDGWTVEPITLSVVEEAYSLPDDFHRDPADRIIVAVARSNNCPVVTADAKIINYPHVATIWYVLAAY